MTPEEEAEWLYRYTERIGMLCEDKTPIQEQITMATREADAVISELRLAKIRARHER
jgi:hypothetical protein